MKRARFPGQEGWKWFRINYGLNNTNGNLPMADRPAGSTWSPVWTVWTQPCSLDLLPALDAPDRRFGVARDGHRQGRAARPGVGGEYPR